MSVPFLLTWALNFGEKHFYFVFHKIVFEIYFTRWNDCEINYFTRWNTNSDDPQFVNFEPVIFDFTRRHCYSRPPPMERARRDLSIGAGLASQLLKTNHLWRYEICFRQQNRWNIIWNHISPNFLWKTFFICVSQILFLWKTVLVRFSQNFVIFRLGIVFHKSICFPC